LKFSVWIFFTICSDTEFFESVDLGFISELSNIDVLAKSFFVFEKFSNSFKLNNQYILIWSWTEILDLIKAELKILQETELLSDIDQLIGLCEVVDKNSFLPLTEKDLSPNIGKKVNSFYEIVDGVIAELNKSEHFNNKGLGNGSSRNKYYVYRNYYR